MLRREYARAIGILPGLKGVEVLVDQACLLTIREEKTDGVWERRVHLKSLDTSNNGFRLLPDQNPGEFPGVAIRTLGDRALVEILHDGQPQPPESQLVIYLHDRAAIEAVVPALLQSIRLCKGSL